MWVIRKTDGMYVAQPGSPGSYTKFLQHARTFYTKESAERECCPENERAVRVDACLTSPSY